MKSELKFTRQKTEQSSEKGFLDTFLNFESDSLIYLDSTIERLMKKIACQRYAYSVQTVCWIGKLEYRYELTYKLLESQRGANVDDLMLSIKEEIEKAYKNAKVSIGTPKPRLSFGTGQSVLEDKGRKLIK